MDKTFASPYIPLWSKYRPVILKLMVDSKEAPQQYQFFSHELKSLNPKEKKALSFTLRVFQGKAQNKIKDSVIANDLLYVLTLSQKATGLMEENTYEFTLTRDCRLEVTLIPGL
jgi:hypothetical protein